MFKYFAASFGALVALSSNPVGGQELGNLLDAGATLWTHQVVSANADAQPGLFHGNGVALTPDGTSLISSSVDGSITSLNALTGEFEWNYVPPPTADGIIVRSHSSPVFTSVNASETYLVYSVVDNENSATPFTRVIALDLDGNMLWISTDLPGVAAGSPVVSADGHYVFLTHNADFKSTGYFTALWAAANGTVFLSTSNETAPFAPPGIYHNPVEGYYDGENGVGNTNDIIMWANAIPPDATTIGQGATFVFQFPVGFNGTAEGLGYLLLGDIARDFLSETAPKITNSGLSAYYSISRSSFVCWVGIEGLLRRSFSRFPTATAGFTRNTDFAGTAVFASPALSSNATEPAVFGGSAFTEFVRLNFDFSDSIIVPTSTPIYAEAKVDPQDRAVYFVEAGGTLHSVNFDDIQDIWTLNNGFPVEGEMALSKLGSILYYGDIRGNITAVQVSEFPPTEPVTFSPTAAPDNSTVDNSNNVTTFTPTSTPSGGVSTSMPTIVTPSPSMATFPPSQSPVDMQPPVEVPASEAPVATPATEKPSGVSSVSVFVSVVVVAACLLI